MQSSSRPTEAFCACRRSSSCVVGDDVGTGPTRLHTPQDDGGTEQVIGTTVTVDEGVKGDDIGGAAEDGKSGVHAGLGGPGATVPGEEGDGGSEGRTLGAESTGDESAEELEGDVAEGAGGQAVEVAIAGVVGVEAGELLELGKEL